MADTTITGLPNATTPLSGSERVPMDQAGVTVDASSQDVANLAGAAIATAVGEHAAAADPHPQYLTPAEGNAAYATTAQGASLLANLQAFRDANRVYVSPRGNDANNGTSEYEPLRTLGAAALAAQPGDLVVVGPGVYTEAALPIRWRRNVGLLCSGLRNTTVRPASGQEMAGIFRVDSGFWCWGLEFAGHQANSATGDLSWAISFNELADNTSIGASGLGAYILKSPYIQNCSSITAEDDAGTAGSVSTGDTGGGIKVDGAACAANSPIRSMVVDSYTQVNLGGPGCLVLNDGYAQLVSFFGTFCTYHVRTESGGQVNLSGGGTSDFGIYGLMADGYSPTPVFTGTSRIANFGAARIEKAVTIDAGTDAFACTAHGLSANDQVVFSASQGALPAPLTTGATYFVRAAGLTADAFTVSATSGGAILDITGTTTGTYSVVRQGVTEIDVVGFGANRLGSTVSRPSAGQLMFPQLVFPRNATTEAAEAKAFTYTRTGANTLTFTEAASPTGPDHEYVSGGTVVIGGTNYGVTAATYDKASGLVTITTTTALPGSNGSTGTVTVSGLVFICPTSAYVVTSSVPIDASGNTVANDSSSRAGYRVLFFSGTNGGLRNTLAVGQVLDFRQRSQISAPSHTFEYVGAGTNYNALPWNGGVPVPANKIVETNNGRIYSSNTDELGNFAVGTQFSVDGTTGSVTINTDQFNLSGLNFIGPFSRNGGISTVGEQIRELSNNASLIASTGAPDGNTAPTQFAVKTYTDNKFLQGLTVTAGQPISVSDTSTVDGQGFQTRNRNIALSMNVANGLARLDGSGLVPAALLPSYVDDVLEFTNLAGFPVTGETSKIYVALDTNKAYRWSGSTYIEISASPGTTDSLSEGSVNLYHTEARVRSAVLTGFTSGAGTVAATDSVLVALQKLAGNIAGAGTGSVTSVGLSLPSLFTVTGSPITSSGTLTATLAEQAAGVVLAGPASGGAAAPTFRALTAGDVNLGTSSTPQFAGLGLGTAAVSGWELVTNGGVVQNRASLTASSGTYTVDVTAANEFITGAAIAGATTINLSNLASIPSGYVWRGVLSFQYTSGTVTWFTGNTGYTVKWDGGTAPTLTASDLETVVITVVGGGTTIEVTAQQGRA